MNDYANDVLLKQQILNIKNDLKKLNFLIDDLNLIMKETIKIDDKIINEGDLILLKTTTNQIIEQIHNEIIIDI